MWKSLASSNPAISANEREFRAWNDVPVPTLFPQTHPHSSDDDDEVVDGDEQDDEEETSKQRRRRRRRRRLKAGFLADVEMVLIHVIKVEIPVIYDNKVASEKKKNQGNIPKKFIFIGFNIIIV